MIFSVKMLQRLKNNLENQFKIPLDARFLLAVSGGVDSMVLLYLFRQFSDHLAVAHCNFNLRGEESDADEQLVRDFCIKYHIPFYSNSFDTNNYVDLHKVSVQVAARELRYSWFKDILEQESYDYLVTAHHADDAVETFLINFNRGTGIDGLLGIPDRNEHIIRPLLIFSREDIYGYALKHSVAWREDASNQSTKYLRNAFRHKVIPVFKENNPHFLSSFQQTLQNLQQVSDLAHDAAEMIWKKVVIQEKEIYKINIPLLLEYNNHKAYLYQWLKEYHFTAWNDIYELLRAVSGKMVYSATHILLKDRDALLLKPKTIVTAEKYYINSDEDLERLPIKLKFELSEATAEKNNNKHHLYADAEKVYYPLIVRKWEQGDFFYPVGMMGKKKVSKFFKDEKFSLFEKQQTWILTTEKNDIIWIIGHRVDERFIHKNSKNQILKIIFN